MGQVLHGSAKTTHAIRTLIQRSKASNAALSRELGINVKTVAKWRKRDGVQDAALPLRPAQSMRHMLRTFLFILTFFLRLGVWRDTGWKSLRCEV